MHPTRLLQLCLGSVSAGSVILPWPLKYSVSSVWAVCKHGLQGPETGGDRRRAGEAQLSSHEVRGQYFGFSVEIGSGKFHENL